MRAAAVVWMAAAMAVAACSGGESPPVAIEVDRTSIVTSEAGGTTTFTLALRGEPDADVVVPFEVTAPNEVALSHATIRFSAGTRDAVQSIVVSPLDDTIADGPRELAIVLAPCESDDPRFDGLDAADVHVTNLDDDTAGLDVFPTEPHVVQETGATSKILLSLTSQPTAAVTLELETDRPDEVQLVPASIAIDPAQWSVSREIEIVGLDDVVADGAQPFTVRAHLRGDDPSYRFEQEVATGTNLDDDTPGFVVSPMSGHAIVEGGASTFAMRLTTRPAADVAIDLATSDAAIATIGRASLVFTPADWNVEQTIEIRTSADDVDRDDRAFAIATSVARSSDADYAGLDPSDVTGVTVDDDNAGIVVAPTSLTLREDGGPNAFAIRLASQPLADVAIALVSARTDEATLSVASVTFTPANWNVPQTVDVTPVQDAVEDGPQLFPIATAPATSADPRYHGLDAVDVTVTNLDDDCSHPHRC